MYQKRPLSEGGHMIDAFINVALVHLRAYSGTRIQKRVEVADERPPCSE